MPNWVINRIEFSGEQEDINKVLDIIKGDDTAFDFNKLVPMPGRLDISSSSDNEIGILCYLSNKMTIPFEELPKKYLKYVRNMFNGDWAEVLYKDRLPNRTEDFDKLYELGKVCCGNIDRYGHIDWYSWRITKWGTKWNASDVYADDDMIEFNTAWSCPLPILDKLAELCHKHNVYFTGKWADEDMGSNAGMFDSYCDGEEYLFRYDYMPHQSNEAYEIYAELHGENYCIGQDENGKWVHYDCEDCPNKDNC